MVTIDAGSQGWGPGPGGGAGESVFNADRVSVWEDEKVLEMFAQQCECT